MLICACGLKFRGYNKLEDHFKENPRCAIGYEIGKYEKTLADHRRAAAQYEAEILRLREKLAAIGEVK
mgnify:CR=1 FL=1